MMPTQKLDEAISKAIIKRNEDSDEGELAAVHLQQLHQHNLKSLMMIEEQEVRQNLECAFLAIEPSAE
eukprot:scaffold26306_cov116-Skeletonema_marinoi.AAC.2